MNQIKRIIHLTLGKALVLCTFALILLNQNTQHWDRYLTTKQRRKTKKDRTQPISHFLRHLRFFMVCTSDGDCIEKNSEKMERR
jgi:hypothetical protein